MPLTLWNAPTTFKRLMENMLRGQSCLVYLDDIIVVGKTFKDHLKNLEEVFRRQLTSNLTLNPKKCSVFQSKVNRLSHIVGKDR